MKLCGNVPLGERIISTKFEQISCNLRGVLHAPMKGQFQKVVALFIAPPPVCAHLCSPMFRKCQMYISRRAYGKSNERQVHGWVICYFYLHAPLYKKKLICRKNVYATCFQHVFGLSVLLGARTVQPRREGLLAYQVDLA